MALLHEGPTPHSPPHTHTHMQHIKLTGSLNPTQTCAVVINILKRLSRSLLERFATLNAYHSRVERGH